MSDTGEITVLAAAATRTYIDDFRYDGLVLEGYARDVCSGGLLPGSGWTYNEIVSRFGGTSGTMYSCRERWDTASNPDCNGQVIDPARTPTFYSTCWSNHARGRAIDVMVGRSGSAYNQTRGINIVNWLLATDSSGSVNSNARRLGVQQILFHDRCWNSDGDRGIATWAQMRPCGIGHFDHVHLDLSVTGANGGTSYWGHAPSVAPKPDMQVFFERSAAWRGEVSWLNLYPVNEGGVGLDWKYDATVVGDFDRDGAEDQTLLWDLETGDWAIENWNAGESTTVVRGTWGSNFDQFRVADLDGDGFLNDLWLWDRDTGNYAVVSWQNYASYYRGSGFFHPPWDGVYPADLDGDGRVNDFLLFDRETAKWAAYSWSSWHATIRAVDYFPLGADDIVVGDWSAGGDLDEILLWDRDTGQWVLYAYAGFQNRFAGVGNWGAAVDIAAPGDYDTDGRTDDVFAYDTESGQWSIYSFHRNTPTRRTGSTWGQGWDAISVGDFVY